MARATNFLLANKWSLEGLEQSLVGLIWKCAFLFPATWQEIGSIQTYLFTAIEHGQQTTIS